MKRFSSILKLLTGTLIVSACCIATYANNVQVTNITLTGQNTDEDYTWVQFDLSWENSWHISDDLHEFWDASWVFVKYRIGNSDQWMHATLDNSTVVAPSGCTVDLTSSGKGAFAYRSSPGDGNNNWTGIQFKWLYGTDGLDDNAIVDVKVFAVEMVYVPEGGFWVGDGTSANRLHIAENMNEAAYISGEGEISLGGTTPGNICTYLVNGTSDIKTTSTEKILPASFPKGYNAFYCMKYEMSEEQFVDFLNCLTRSQQQSRVKSDISQDQIYNTYVMSNSTISSAGNTIQCPENNNGISSPIQFFSSAPERACGYISYYDLRAYLDWVALRPMTCLEYEKACRGTDMPAVQGEFAWGNNVYNISNISVENEGADNEILLFSYSAYFGSDFTNANFSNATQLPYPQRPLRCGIFASSAPVMNRIQTGSSIYGIMEMTGNLQELAYNIDCVEGRLYDGSHGDGELDDSGDADVLNWPTYTYSLCIKGGDYFNKAVAIGYRGNWWNSEKFASSGIRGVRTVE